MPEIRFILCQGDACLPAMVRLLARAIVVHLEDWAVVLDPSGETGGVTLYRPDAPPRVLAAAPMRWTLSDVRATIDAELAGALDAPRAVQFLVLHTVDDAFLRSYIGGNPAFFHVVSPIVPFSDEPASPTPEMTQWLRPDEGRFMPAVLLPAEKTGHAGPLTLYPIGDGWHAPDPPERDACRMRIDPAAAVLADARGQDFASLDERVRKPLERWARTVTCRRVGIVISGGGASVFRLAKLFEALEDKGVPIDLISGVSGGTVFASAYAVGGLDKVDEVAAQGNAFTLAVVGALANSWFVERFIDRSLGGCGLRNTEIRVLPLSTTFPPMMRPQAGAVVDGTFGQAVRASGGAPFFAPYFPNGGNVRHMDGAIMACTPPPFLAKRFGADIVFAANVLSPPATRFPGETVPVVRDIMGLFYRHTLFGRVADTWNACSTMLHGLSEGNGLDADLFVTTKPRDWGMIEWFLLYNAPKYMEEGLDGVDLDAAAATCLARWNALP